MKSRGPVTLAAIGLARRPAFTATVVLTLALGVGANVAVFSLVDAGLLRALPYPDAGRLVLAWEARPDRGWSRFGVSAPAFRGWRRDASTLRYVAAFYEAQANVEGPAGAERVEVLHASADLLPALGLRPHLGRGLEPGDERPGSPAVVLGFGFWRSAFGGDPSVLGRTLRVGRESVTVVGVLPPGLGPPFASPAIVRPLSLDGDDRRGDRWLSVLARVAPSRTVAQARAELEALARRQAAEHPDTNAGWTVTVVGLPEAAREDGRLLLLLLSGAAGLVLVLACANVGHLLAGRALGRERELAIRAALGAGPRQLAQPVLAETLALAVLGGLAGLAFGAGGLALLRSVVPAASAAAAVDARALAAGLALGALSAILVALLPVAYARRAVAPATLRGPRVAASTPSRRRLRRALVVVEMAIAFVLVAGAFVLVRTVRHLLDTDPGFQAAGALAFRVAPPQVSPSPGQTEEAFVAALLSDRDRAAAFYARLIERLSGLPGIASVAAVNRLPLTGGWWVMRYEVAGETPAAAAEQRSAFGRVVTPRYFGTIGIPLLAGRELDGRDAASTQPVVVVDETLAREAFGGRSPLGAVLRIDDGAEATVVGVVGATRAVGLDRLPAPTFYVPLSQARFGFFPDWGMDVVVRPAAAAGRPPALAPLVRGVLREVDPTLPAYAMRPLDTLVRDALARRREALRLIGAFSLLALALAAVGAFGVLAELARERSREFGVRLALGARPAQLGALVLGEGLALAVAGSAFGLAGAAAAGRALGALLHGISPADPMALGGTAALLLATVALTAVPPVMRAIRADPAALLRDE